MSTPTPEAESLKDRGNELFARGKYGASIDAYTNALDLCPRWIVPLVNRALMYRHKRDWANVRADCERALSIDREHMKANYYLGLAMIGEGAHPDAARRLNKALESARTQGASIQTEIWRMYALAKYYEWAAAASKRKARYDAIEAKLAAACGVEVPSKTGERRTAGRVRLTIRWT
jgi:STIP1 family protein 1